MFLSVLWKRDSAGFFLYFVMCLAECKILDYSKGEFRSLHTPTLEKTSESFVLFSKLKVIDLGEKQHGKGPLVGCAKWINLG